MNGRELTPCDQLKETSRFLEVKVDGDAVYQDRDY